MTGMNDVGLAINPYFFLFCSRWKWRQRIRMTLSGENAHDAPVDLHNQQLDFPEHRFFEHVKENEEHSSEKELRMLKPTRVLPILALNEVFIGESLSAR